jgi:hypothetical protein
MLHKGAENGKGSSALRDLGSRLVLVLECQFFGSHVLDVSVWRISLRCRLLLCLLDGCWILPGRLLPVTAKRGAERVLQAWRSTRQ